MHRPSLAVAALAALCPLAIAQPTPVARLPWDRVLTAGPNCTDYDDDTLDLYPVEDFGIDHAASILRFESEGTVTGSQFFVTEVTARIYAGFPPTGGTVVMESIPGTGRLEGSLGAGFRFVADFDGSVLPAGDYYIAFTTRPPAGRLAIAWSTMSQHTVGRGEPNNGWLWNPGGGRGYEDNYKKVPADLKGNGQSGVNFTIYGEPVACEADIDGDGDADADDFFAYLDLFASGDPEADLDGDGDRDADDFFVYLDRFVSGC
ncbi:MAG: hypothetical protein H6811_08680 [Phycisphaeraceae bacterium]|nr:hypothetical protein [Phycisphaeraceae bacterium]